MRETIASMMREGHLKLPGVKLLSPEIPADLVDQPPPLPKLNVLVMGGPQQSQLQLPVALIKKYAAHSKFGEDWNLFMDKSHTEFGVAESNQPSSSSELGSPDKQKRKIGEAPVSPEANKESEEVGP